MPLQDTLWLNDEDYFYNSSYRIESDSELVSKVVNFATSNPSKAIKYCIKNTAHNDSIITQVRSLLALQQQQQYNKEKSYYDGLYEDFVVILLIGFVALVCYAFYRKNKKARNPFDENDNDWIELGSHSNNNYSNDDDEPIFFRKTPPTPPPTKPSFYVYDGLDFKFTSTQLHEILQKRFPYYRQLNTPERNRFIQRLQKFIKSKYFEIHQERGFIEMPVLTSAAAIQLSFGLNDYLLPHYKVIAIFPKEFLKIEPHIRFLEGNVSGHTIHVSWKHFLEGYDHPHNGQNVGLHEMAHAYYCQNITVDYKTDDDFVFGFKQFVDDGTAAFDAEKNNEQKLYSNYALQNLHEFWAESVELFFERPDDLKNYYPQLYATMCLVLNQYPLSDYPT